jgi:ATP-dependent Clp protease ATP-binding subunit ClpA
VLRQRIENEVASLILAGSVEEGDRVLVDADGTDFRFETIRSESFAEESSNATR